MPFDYSQTDDPRDFSELIPHNTIATVQMRIRPGNAGPDGLYKRTARGDAEMLDCEFVALDGPFAKRKFWDNFMLAGSTDGQKEMVLTNRGRLKKILESARGIKKGDTSEQNLALYRAEDKDFNNIIFVARIGVKKGEPKNDGSGTSWSDKNYLLAAITPDQKDWHPVEQPPPFNGGGATAPTGARRWTPHPRARSPSPRRHGHADAQAPHRRDGLGDGPRGRMAAARHRRRHRGRAQRRHARRPHPTSHAGRATERHRAGLGPRRDAVRLDPHPRRAGGRGRARHRADHPNDGARSGALGRRRRGGDPARAREYELRLVTADHSLAEAHNDRVLAHGHAAPRRSTPAPALFLPAGTTSRPASASS